MFIIFALSGERNVNTKTNDQSKVLGLGAKREARNILVDATNSQDFILLGEGAVLSR